MAFSFTRAWNKIRENPDLNIFNIERTKSLCCTIKIDNTMERPEEENNVEYDGIRFFTYFKHKYCK